MLNFDRGKPGFDPLWYKDAIIYELHVRSFFDSNDDGIGDFRGLIQKLDYISDLGATALWLLPFYPSPLKDDGYDTADYMSIHPDYGTLADFELLVEEAHKRNVRIITELVINHTSDQHPWFQRSRRAPEGSAWRNYYVWSNDIEKYKETRIIFPDFEPSNWTWDPVAKSFYWHRFYSHQPDLNFDNPVVHDEIFKIVDFWLEKGVDGFRLDAIPYLYEREGTSSESLPETHAFLKKLRRHVDEKFGDRVLLAEANQWPETAVTYFGQGRGDECHMAFHFPLMPRLFMALQMEDRIPIVDIMEQTPALPETSQWALFLRNHDELTLEMVTDEERDYMWRVYATQPKARINLGIRHRLAPLLGNSRSKIELMNQLLFSLPGTPVIYYGDEIGMGDNVYLGDRNGVRTPMHWSSDRNAGFSRANPQSLQLPVILDPEYHFEANNVEAQQRNPNSLLWWTKRLIALRKQLKAFGQGSLGFVHSKNRKVLAFIRKHEDETILVIANLSRFPQPLELDLSQFEGCVPTELFGRTKFPAISNLPYPLSLDAHSTLWFRLEPKVQGEFAGSQAKAVHVSVSENWPELFSFRHTRQLAEVLLAYVKTRHWYMSRDRDVLSARVWETLSIQTKFRPVQLCFLKLEFSEGEDENYLVPVSFAQGENAERLTNGSPQWVIASVQVEKAGEQGILFDAIGDEGFAEALMNALAENRQIKGTVGELSASATAAFQQNVGDIPKLFSRIPGERQHHNSGIVFGDRYYLKIFRRIDPGANPDIEAIRFLTQQNFANIPEFAGSLSLRRSAGQFMDIGLLTAIIPETQTAWDHTIEELVRYFEELTAAKEPSAIQDRTVPLIELAGKETPAEVVAQIGNYLQAAALLGTRTAEMHLSLAAESDDRNFAPEPFTPFYQRSAYQSMRNLTLQTIELLEKRMSDWDPALREKAGRVISSKNRILKCLQAIYEIPIHAMRIRCHGDFHLGQVLYDGKDFSIIDFEGEPARPLSERKIKRSPMRDVAGMIRSFDYAAEAALRKQFEIGSSNPEQIEALRPWRRQWRDWASAAFLKAYFDGMGSSGLLPASSVARRVLLDTSVLEKAVYELGYELKHRPDWVEIPMRGILNLLDLWKPL